MLGKTVAAWFDLTISAKIRQVFMSLLVNCCWPGCMGLAKSKHGVDDAPAFSQAVPSSSSELAIPIEKLDIQQCPADCIRCTYCPCVYQE